MKCPNCGKDNPLGSKFCNGCGEKLPEQNLEQIWEEAQEGTKEQVPITTEKAKFTDVLDKRLITAIGIILALFVIGIIITVYVKSCVESQNSSVVATTEANTESTAAELLAESDLDRTASFYDVKFKVSTKWEHKNGYDENGDIYQINGKYYFVSAQRQEATTEVADAFIKLICDNDDNEYTSIMEDNINGADGVTYSVVIDDKSYTRTTCFYRNGYIYSVALTALKEYKSVVDESFLLIRSSIKFAEIETEPETEKPTEPETEPSAPEPTEAPKPTEPIIDNPTSTGGWGAHGTGDYVAEGLNVEGYAVLTINYYGDGNFSVVSYENGDDYDDLLVNEIGNYSGRVLIDHGGKFDLEINADGEWTIETSGLSVDDSTSFSGTGDCVTGITTHSGGNWEITNDGDSNFAVIQYGVKSGYMDLMVNEIGYYQGTVKSEKAQNDNIFFEVNSDGNWTIKRK